MLRSLSLKTAWMIAVALPVISQCPPTWLGESSALLATAVAEPVSTQTITVFDAVGDARYSAPAFRDIVSNQMTKTAGGDFELLMEMADSVPVAPPLPPTAHDQVWWAWGFDLDPTASPKGYPFPPGDAAEVDFVVYVSWDGTAFAATAIDRRPLLTGGEAVVTPVSFSINGTMVEAVLPYTLIGEVPSSFAWRNRTMDWSGPVGSGGYRGVDGVNFDP